VDPIGSGLVSGAHTAVLVEGASDKSAIEALAQRHGRNLAAEGISLVAMGEVEYLRRLHSARR
jgi:predicted ATP-dependent endonuclease of OLD family